MSHDPTSRLLTLGAHTLTENELVELVFGPIEPERLERLRRFEHQDDVGSIPKDRWVWMQAWEQLKKDWLRKQLTGTPLSCADQVRDYLQNRLAASRIEQVLAIYLDASLHLISSEIIAQGTVNQAPIYPREILRGAIQSDACAVILAHNHPSGQSQPSAADLMMTERLSGLLAELDIRLVDHFVVTQTQITSINTHNGGVRG